MKASIFMTLVSIGLFAMMLAGCSTTRAVPVTVQTPRANVADPRGVYCEPVNIEKESEVRYVMNDVSYRNLNDCLAEHARWAMQAKTVMEVLRR